ncbi:hypothetical protein ACFXPX_10790 [Kitasatospora sp. NPDC059146]|uniref:hypothetical protein n=1 Tax=Kitasatospora sp. NPDC059146 TaxID=3346741 RepID=UPI00367C3F42
MNPHDPLVRPGAHLVFDRLGVENPWELYARHPGESPLTRVAFMVASCAREVDRLHQDLTAKAQQVTERLAPIARGDHASMRGVNGVMQSAGLQVELLAARRGAAFEQLSDVVSAYERCTEEGLADPRSPLAVKRAAVTASPAPAAEPDLPGTPSRYDPRTREFEALAAIDRGRLRLCKSAVYGYTFTSDGSGVAPSVWAHTVEALMAEDLVVADTSTSSYRPGQLLSLTPAGQALLDASRTADQRVAAALARTPSGPVVTPATGPAQTAPLAPSARPSLSSSRTR